MSDDLVRVEPPDIAHTELAPRAELVLPRLIVDAGPAAVARFLEFFAARIANRRTRAAPVLSPAEARRLLEAIDTGTPAGLRDRALVSVMLYSFARVSAVIGMRRQDYFRQERRGWLRLHEKGGTRHDVPAHHRAAEALDDYLEAAGLDEPTAADGPGAVAASRPGHDQAAGGGRGSAALDLLPHVSGDGDHGVSVERGDARTRADRRARLPEDDEALRSDGGHDHRRDRAHRDLGGGRTARRRAPRDVRAARRDGRAARGRVRHGGFRLARTLDPVVRLRLVPPGGGGVSAARPSRRAAPTRDGALWPHTRRVRQYRSLAGWPACPGPGFARLDLMERRYAWLRRAFGSSSRIWNPGASGGGAGP